VTEDLDYETLSELLSLLAHDLRNPLSALQSNVGFLSSLISRDNGDAHEAIADAVLSCDGLAYIIDSLETLAQQLGTAPALDKGPFALGPMLEEAVHRCESLAVSHEVELQLDEGSRARTERVLAHRDMASRALSALVRNAIQHAPLGSSVRVSTAPVKDRWVVSVIDDGQALLDAISEEAFTAHGQIKTKSLSGGRYSRGLGLFCARFCAESAGARVGVGRAEQGSVLELSLELGL
jgi:signal transduction histidine kinase